MSKKFRSTLLSCIIWGSGQFFVCKQRLKGVLLFAAQVLFIAIELLSGLWQYVVTGQISPDVRTCGGFFTKGIWGLITLGKVQFSDNSAILLINGITALLLIIVFAGIYIFNIVDSYKMSEMAETANGLTLSDYRKNFTRKLFPYLVLSPVVLLMLFILFMPIVFSVLTAFTNYDANHMPPASLFKWVGLTNFLNLVNISSWASTFLSVLIWTIIWALCVTFISYFLGLLQATLLNSSGVKCKALFRSIFILPWAIPGMVSLLVFRNMFNGQFGAINQVLLKLGIIHTNIPFFTNAMVARITVIGINVWLGFAPFMVMLLGVLSNQDTTLYEAAEIDGASKFKVFSYIKLPLLNRAMAPLIVMNLATNFNAFSSIYFLTNGGPQNASKQIAGDTDILISWIYTMTVDHSMYDMAAVMNILIFIFIAVVSYWNFRRTTSFKEM